MRMRMLMMPMISMISMMSRMSIILMVPVAQNNDYEHAYYDHPVTGDRCLLVEQGDESIHDLTGSPAQLRNTGAITSPVEINGCVPSMPVSMTLSISIFLSLYVPISMYIYVFDLD